MVNEKREKKKRKIKDESKSSNTVYSLLFFEDQSIDKDHDEERSFECWHVPLVPFLRKKRKEKKKEKKKREKRKKTIKICQSTIRNLIIAPLSYSLITIYTKRKEKEGRKWRKKKKKERKTLGPRCSIVRHFRPLNPTVNSQSLLELKEIHGLS